MKTKDQLRKKFLELRKKRYFEVSSKKLYQIANHIKKKYVKKKKNFYCFILPVKL